MATLSEADSLLSAALQAPPKMYLQDLKTLETVEMQFNPEKLEETIAVEWARLKPLGLSHEVLQYDHTGNHKVAFELIFDALAAGGTDRMNVARRFLLSLCYSKKGAQTVSDGEATRVLFVWPGFMSLTSVITSLKFTHTRFNVAAAPTLSACSVALEEIRDVRLFSEDVREMGTQRTPLAASRDVSGGDVLFVEEN